MNNVVIPLGLSYGLKVVEMMNKSSSLDSASISMDAFSSSIKDSSSSGVVMKNENTAQIARVTANMTSGGLRLYLGTKKQIANPLYLPNVDINPIDFVGSEADFFSGL